jgi:hypothetical protein
VRTETELSQIALLARILGINALMADGKLHEVNGVVLTVVESVNDFEQLRLF